MIKLKQFVFSPFAENTFVVWDDSSNEAMVVDPGCLEKHEEEELQNFVTANKLQIKFLINTHCHIDHIFGNSFVKETFTPKYYAPEDDVFLLAKALEQAKLFDVKIKVSPEPDAFITEDLVLTLGECEAKFLYTPGHTPGEFCVYFQKEKICITGDVLFNEGIGRTDLWGGDYNTLINSIKTKLLTLPDDITIYPGHGESSTIGHERVHNTFLK